MVVEPLKMIREQALDTDGLKALYRWMVTHRAYDEKGYLLARAGKIAIYYSATGEEAAVVGSAAALEAQDWIFPYYREAGAFLVRGMPMVSMFGQLFGNQADHCLGHQSPIHYSYARGHVVTVSSPVGTQITQAVGAAMAVNIQANKHQNPARPVILCYLGDGATSSNDFHAGMTFAGVFKSPVVFICKNNQWAISLPVRKQTAVVNLADKAKAYGIAGQVVDGNDVLAVFEATRQAVERARNGEGAQFLELKTYRVGPHSTPDDPKRYRSEEEEAAVRPPDPLLRYRQFLERQNLWNDTQEQALWTSVREEINQATAKAEAAAPLSWETLFEDVYRELPPMLIREKEVLGQEIETGVPEEDPARETTTP